jgi:hypothetical protein
VGPGGPEQASKKHKLLDLNVLVRTGRKQLLFGSVNLETPAAPAAAAAKPTVKPEQQQGPQQPAGDAIQQLQKIAGALKTLADAPRGQAQAEALKAAAAMVAALAPGAAAGGGSSGGGQGAKGRNAFSASGLPGSIGVSSPTGDMGRGPMSISEPGTAQHDAAAAAGAGPGAAAAGVVKNELEDTDDIMKQLDVIDLMRKQLMQ